MAVIYKVTISDRQSKVDLPVGVKMLVRRTCVSVLRHENFNYDSELSVTFVDNMYIQSLNKQYRDIDSPTDMLSFPASESGYEIDPDTGSRFLGDIVLSAEKALEEATIENTTIQEKIMLWTSHSLLHLLGYDHEKNPLDLVKMTEISEHVAQAVGAPYMKYRLSNGA